MRGVVFRGDRRLEVMSFDDPTPGPGEAVVEMKASGMCGSDLHYYRGNPADIIRQMGLKSFEDRGMAADTAIIAGHEPCGVIVALGAGTEDAPFKVGDRVIVFHYEGCRHCDHCRTGWTQMCVNGADVHGVVIHGGHADYMKVPLDTLVRMPDDISFIGGAAIACGTGTAYGALGRLNISARDTLAVFGLGPVGLSAVQLAAAMGVEVIGVDIAPDRVEKAKSFGAAHVVNGAEKDAVDEIRKLTGGRGVTCAMDCAGGDAVKAQAVRCTAPWGRIALIAVGGNLNVDGMKDLISKQRTVIGSYTFSEVGMKQCAEFISRKGIEVDRLFTDTWDIADADAAYRSFDKQAGGKGVFVF